MSHCNVLMKGVKNQMWIGVNTPNASVSYYREIIDPSVPNDFL